MKPAESDPPPIPNIHLNTPLFKDKIADIIRNNNISLIIESGTNDGTGSTEVFAKTGATVLSCEANKEKYDAAVTYLSPYENVSIYHAYTICRDYINIIYRDSLLKRGTSPEKENWLSETFHRHFPLLKDGESIIVFLDSHWTNGFIEFSVIFNHWYRRRPLRNKIFLILDDATNLKHRPSIHFIKSEKIDVKCAIYERWAIIELE